jgi:hypothetical protein
MYYTAHLNLIRLGAKSVMRRPDCERAASGPVYTMLQMYHLNKGGSGMFWACGTKTPQLMLFDGS